VYALKIFNNLIFLQFPTHATALISS